MVREERNKTLQEKLEQTRTIRNLNDSLDLLKRINVDHERTNMERATHTKTKEAVQKPEHDKKHDNVQTNRWTNRRTNRHTNR